MDQDQQRDAAEEKYNREFCGACGTSPCGWDGEPDGFHTDSYPGIPEIPVQDAGITRAGFQAFRIDRETLRQALESGTGTIRYLAPPGFRFGPDRRLHPDPEPGADRNHAGLIIMLVIVSLICIVLGGIYA